MTTLENIGETGGRLIAASQVNGTSVYDNNGERIGRVEDVMLDKHSGQIPYAVLSFGGFLGLGDKHHPLPWNQLKYDTTLGGYIVSLDRDQLEGSPAINSGEAANWDDETWSRRLREYYSGLPGVDAPLF